MANDIFLKIEGIPGESADKAHKDEIEVLSYSWGVDQAGQSGHVGGGMGAGKATFRDFSFGMRVSQASTPLFLACAAGKHIPKATLTVRKAGAKPVDYLIIEFKDIVITSLEQVSGDEMPMERVAFAYANLEITYAPQDARGRTGPSSKAGWDLQQNVKI